MNIKTEIKEYGFPVTHNCVRSETRITELEAQLAAAQAEITRLRSLASELAIQENQFQEEELSRATMRFLCPVCRKAAASSDDANLCCAYDIPAESTKGGEEKAVAALLEMAEDGLDPRTPEYGVGFEGE